MSYSIKQFAEKIGVTVSTLRYYDKEGLLPFIDKSENGTRIFKEEDFEGLSIISCLKKSGVPIKDIKKYMDLCVDGDNTLEERMAIFQTRKEIVQNEIEELNNIMETIKYKIWYYEEAIKAGTEDIHKKEKNSNKQIV